MAIGGTERTATTTTTTTIPRQTIDTTTTYNPSSDGSCGFFDVWDPFACGISSLLISCRDTLCKLPEEKDGNPTTNTRKRPTMNKTLSSSATNVFLDPCCHTIQHNDSMSTATPRDFDPQKVFFGTADSMMVLDRMSSPRKGRNNDDDDDSCNSSISSKGMGKGPDKESASSSNVTCKQQNKDLFVPPKVINAIV